MKKKLRIGVVGVGRGGSMMNYCRASDNAVLVAICDKWAEGIEAKKHEYAGESIGFYTDYDEFLSHDMDAVVLANYATEHAPFAVKAMKRGFDVISEVLPCQTMKEAVELVETVEETGRTYCYAENYCFMPAPREMKKLYREGKIGEVTYCEGEYVHNCEPGWIGLTYGDKNHWRNTMYSTYYCTHSIGPMVHITGLRPVKVTGFEVPFDEQCARMGYRSGLCGIEMMTLSNGSIAKSIHGNLYRNNISYIVYGTKGRMESARETAWEGDVSKLYLEYDAVSGDYSDTKREVYNPTDDKTEAAKPFGHGGSDYYTIWNAVEYLSGNKEADVIDVYEALDMFLPGMFAYRSILAGGASLDIPDLRLKSERDKWRNDTACTSPAVAGDMLLPSNAKNADVPDEVYAAQKRIWLESHTER